MTLLLLGINMIFWRGLMVYPLSDFLAVFLSFLSAILLYHILKKEEADYKFYILGFSFGAVGYCAYNVRTIYMFSVIFAIGFTIYYFLKRKIIIRLVKFIIMTIFGIFCAGIPQAIINNALLNIKSIQVPTDSLMVKQLFWGLFVQRYETFIGLETSYSQSSGMRFMDSAGEAIIEKLGIYEVTLIEYIKLILEYPLDCIGIYIRHFINMLLPIFPDMYIEHLNGPIMFYLLLNFMLLALFLLGLVKFRYRMKKDNKILCILAIPLIPCLCILPGAVEIRFFYGAYLLMYGYLFYVFSFRELFGELRKHPVKYIISGVLLLSLLIAVWGSTLASLPFEKMFLS